MAPSTKIRSVRIEDDIWERAAAKARARGENLSVVIRRALIDYAAGNEAATRLAAVAAWAEAAQGVIPNPPPESADERDLGYQAAGLEVLELIQEQK